MIVVTGQALWKAFSETQSFASLPKSIREANKSFILVIPAFLTGMLDDEISIATILEARLVIANAAQPFGLVEKLVSVMPDQRCKRISRDGLLQSLNGLRKSMVAEIEMQQNVHKNVHPKLFTRDMSEQVYLATVLLSEENAKAHNRKPLTIGQLLLSQPECFWTAYLSDMLLTLCS